ncbi:hypothetical protein N566_05930 [Streptomycetaceae bacterium MP113-05]|nr:hypothetical protein N566_05930 [Streptomycetaceae bacterium MP113-05]
MPELDVQISLQVKSRRVDNPSATGAGFPVSLSVEQYRRLRGRRQVPCYLVMVVVPPDPRDFARVEEQALILRHSAYWLSLEQHVPVQQGQKSVTVTVPRDNLLTIDVLHKLFGRACEEVPA